MGSESTLSETSTQRDRSGSSLRAGVEPVREEENEGFEDPEGHEDQGSEEEVHHLIIAPQDLATRQHTPTCCRSADSFDLATADRGSYLSWECSPQVESVPWRPRQAGKGIAVTRPRDPRAPPGRSRVQGPLTRATHGLVDASRSSAHGVNCVFHARPNPSQGVSLLQESTSTGIPRARIGCVERGSSS